MYLLNNVLVLCHGRKHRVIKEISYEMDQSKFLDINLETDPDYQVDISEMISAEDIEGKQFDHVINAFAPLEIEFGTHDQYTHDLNGNVIDGQLSEIFFHNVRTCLRDHGLFYIRPLFNVDRSSEKNIQLMKDKLFKFGLRFQSIRTFTFGEVEMPDFLECKKVPLPTQQEVWDYLNERILIIPAIRTIKLTFFNLDSDSTDICQFRLKENIHELEEYFTDSERVTDNYLELRKVTIIAEDDTSTELF